MLDGSVASSAEILPYRAPTVLLTLAREPWQRAAYERIRRAIFVEEQALFAGSDRDEHDETALPIVAIGLTAGTPDEVVGVVRIYETKPGLWYGGRLGLAHGYRRRSAVGSLLVNAAVATARALGATRFLATIQLANVTYFERQHFRVCGPALDGGVQHQLMAAELARFSVRHSLAHTSELCWSQNAVFNPSEGVAA